MVSQIDDSIGLLLAALEASGSLEDTVILYTSDHGDTCGSRGMLDKHYILYDDVVKVPLILAGPGICPGKTPDALVSVGLDLAPTVDELFGVHSPEAQGRSLLPVLQGVCPEDWRTAVTASSNGQQFGLYTNRMIRDGRYKYIWNLTDIDEFYDLETDPGEKVNLICNEQQAPRIAEMRKALYEQLKAYSDPFATRDWVTAQLLEGRKHTDRA